MLHVMLNAYFPVPLDCHFVHNVFNVKKSTFMGYCEPSWGSGLAVPSQGDGSPLQQLSDDDNTAVFEKAQISIWKCLVEK